MPAYGPIAAARIKGLEAERDRLRQALEALLDTAAVRLDACAGSKVVAAARNRVELRISISVESWADAEGMVNQIGRRLAEADEGDHEHVDVASGGPGGSWSMVGDRDSGVDLEGRREKLDAWLEARRQARAETE